MRLLDAHGGCWIDHLHPFTSPQLHSVLLPHFRSWCAVTCILDQSMLDVQYLGHLVEHNKAITDLVAKIEEMVSDNKRGRTPRWWRFRLSPKSCQSEPPRWHMLMVMSHSCRSHCILLCWGRWSLLRQAHPIFTPFEHPITTPSLKMISLTMGAYCALCTHCAQRLYKTIPFFCCLPLCCQ